MAEIHPHLTVAGLEPTDALFRPPNLDIVLKFAKMNRSLDAPYRREQRMADEELLRTMQTTWPQEVYDAFVAQPQLSRRLRNPVADTARFTPSNVYAAFIGAGIPIPPGLQERYTRARQAGNTPNPKYVVMADGRRFAAQYLDPELEMPRILAMHYCFNKAVQQLMQAAGSQRRAIRKLLAYWKTQQDVEGTNRRIKTLIGGSLSKTQPWDLSDDTEMAPKGWDDTKASALQYFWLATMYYLDALVLPPPPMADSGVVMAKDINVLVPNPERVRYNQILFTTVGPYIYEQNRLSMGTMAYACIIVAPTPENSSLTAAQAEEAGARGGVCGSAH